MCRVPEVPASGQKKDPVSLSLAKVNVMMKSKLCVLQPSNGRRCKAVAKRRWQNKGNKGDLERDLQICRFLDLLNL